MRIEELRSKHYGHTIYVVGTGPSMRTFPLDVLQDEVTIGLNQAWRYCQFRYNLTVHPELLRDYLADPDHQSTQWIIKHKAPLNLPLDDPEYYVFYTSENTGVIDKPVADTLYCGRGVQQTAMHLAAWMGAGAIVLVGVDMCALDNEHHGHEQHVRWLGWEPDDVYREYYEYTANVRRIIQDKLGIPVLTLNPFLGLNRAEEDFRRLRQELKIPPLPTPTDVSPYFRPRK